MIFTRILFVIIFGILVNGCQTSEPKNKPQQQAAIILKDFNSFWSYLYNTDLSEDFNGLDENAAAIDLKLFFQRLQSGNYLPLKTGSNKLQYLLFPLADTVEKNISSTLQQWCSHQAELFNRRGTILPHFNFTDINGTVYNTETTAGKTVVIKCWFKACVPCVAEIPLLEELKKTYINRQDVVFMSMVLDEQKEIRKFLKERQFDNAVIAGQKKYLLDEILITSFPTYIVIDKTGRIYRVVNDFKKLAAALKKITA